MKASKLIEELKILISEHGDLDVFLTYWSEEYNQPTKVVSTFFSDHGEKNKFIIDA